MTDSVLTEGGSGSAGRGVGARSETVGDDEGRRDAPVNTYK